MSVEKENFFLLLELLDFRSRCLFSLSLFFQQSPLLVERRFRYHPAREGMVTFDGRQANHLLLCTYIRVYVFSSWFVFFLPFIC